MLCLMLFGREVVVSNDKGEKKIVDYVVVRRDVGSKEGGAKAFRTEPSSKGGKHKFCVAKLSSSSTLTMFSPSGFVDSHKDGDGDALFQLKSDSLPHAHAQTIKTYYKHQDSRIMKAQELKTKTSAQTLIYKIFLQRYQVYQGRLLASFQDDAKYEHVGQDTRSQGGKDDQDERIKI
ncbi:hypothetical protein Tco_1041150 [Tanacetum coccineum]|uniref:Uncharacterized protein n=1 Tax=Tanacetum coccineum TaxID=301880 RepID=A0ABQ5GG09_9ASTR